MSSERRPIYLDYAATTPVDVRVAAEMMKYLTQDHHFGNAGSDHYYGHAADKAVERARAQVADLINASAKEIIWTSGATEANNLAIRGVAQAYAQKGRHFITATTEHKSVLDTFKALAQAGCSVTYLNVDSTGRVDLHALEHALRDDTVLVSIMQVNNETGVMQDIQAISHLVHQKKALLHVDAVQSVGKIAIDVDAWQVDLLSLSAHKIYGPKGIGALYIRQKPRVRVTPIITGGNQERGLRAGTLATHQIVAMGAACELAKSHQETDAARMIHLRELLFAKLTPLDGLQRNSPKDHSAPHILNISIAGVHGEALLFGLQAEVALSNGSACNAHNIEASHVLTALGLNQELAQSTLRFSLGRFTTEAEILAVARRVVDYVTHLRRLSPYWMLPLPQRLNSAPTNDKMMHYLHHQQRIGILDEKQPAVMALHAEQPMGLMRCSFYLSMEQGWIIEVKYKVYGCGVTIACAAWVAEFLESKNLTAMEIQQLQPETIIKALDVPLAKQYSALMVSDMVKELRKKYDSFNSKCSKAYPESISERG